MSTADAIADLQSRFGIENTVLFEQDPGGLIRLMVTTPAVRGQLYLQGAHVTGFQPAGVAPLLFTSDHSSFEPGRPIRGGVPICFPWFAAKADDADAPMHGFVRHTVWDVTSVTQDDALNVDVTLKLTSRRATRRWWPHEFEILCSVSFSKTLAMSLTVTNPQSDGQGFRYEAALHTYLAVADVRRVSIRGLRGAAFIDKTEGLAHRIQADDPLTIQGETDRIYVDTNAPCIVDDPGLERRLTVSPAGTHNTVVWNPWVEKAKRLTDLGDDQWQRMLCIETANVGEHAVHLPPGRAHTMTARVGCDTL